MRSCFRGFIAVLAAILSPAVALAAPSLLPQSGVPVEWLFVFKLGSTQFGTPVGQGPCVFGGTPATSGPVSLRYIFASAADAQLQDGAGAAGTSISDPLGATFDQIYNGDLHYVVWNDQFYDSPRAKLCSSCGKGTGHSKGVLAWDDAGEGIVLQVTTPSWPASRSARYPRDGAGNTLGCIQKPNNIKFSQHFFALKLNRPDVIAVLEAMRVAGVVTDPANPQIVNNGGPADIADRVSRLGKVEDLGPLVATLSSGVRLVAKPPSLPVTPWQFVRPSLAPSISRRQLGGA